MRAWRKAKAKAKRHGELAVFARGIYILEMYSIRTGQPISALKDLSTIFRGVSRRTC